MTGDSPALTGIDNPQWAPCGRCGELAYRCACTIRAGVTVSLNAVTGEVTATDGDGAWVRWESGAHNRVPWGDAGRLRVVTDG